MSFFVVGKRKLEETTTGHATIEIMNQHTFSLDLQQSFCFQFVEANAV